MLEESNRELVEAASRLIAARDDRERHTVAAATRDRTGTVHTAVNLYHFTGGPCAELVAMAVAAAATAEPLTTMVAVGGEGRGVLAPCGRCRQVMFDYFPDLSVILPGDLVMPVVELLPHGFVWEDQQNRQT